MSWRCTVVESICLECMRPCIRTRHQGLNTSDYWGVKQTFLSVTPFGIICQMTFHINLQLYLHIYLVWQSRSLHPVATFEQSGQAIALVPVQRCPPSLTQLIGAEEMAQWLSSCWCSAEALGSAPSTHMLTFNCSGNWRPLLASSDISHTHHMH